VWLRRDEERAGTASYRSRDPAIVCRTAADYLTLAARHRRIITDRLHFAIAGLHAGRDVTLLANDYHKNRSMHETWLADLGCRFATTLDEALVSRTAA
jgi:exopolysaccharide biosynthesis predicted pyruvyltransferase EpsI